MLVLVVVVRVLLDKHLITVLVLTLAMVEMGLQAV
jgi:hypothetical protein